MNFGRGQSKLIAEQVLNNAAQVGTPASLLRMESLAPKAGGPWPEAYGLAAFTRTCKASGSIVTDLADLVDWLPADGVASVIEDVVQYDLSNLTDSGLRVLNLVHPDPVPWDTLIPALRSYCGKMQSLCSRGNGYDS